jgi:hypothetical protein
MPALGGFPITEEELSFLRELSRNGAKFMIVGMSAAILQGADGGTKDIDLWFQTTSDGRLSKAASSVGGIFIWRASPPCLGGEQLARVDLVNRMSGLYDFDVEYEGAVDCRIDDFIVKLLPLERIITSKKASGRLKDKAILPSLRALLKATTYLK